MCTRLHDRHEFLAGQSAVEVLGYAVLSNHLHVVLRDRPDLVRTWSDEQTPHRGWNLFPARKEEDGNPAKPEEHERAMLLSRTDSGSRDFSNE